MIFDQLKNSHIYFALGERVQKGFEFLLNSDLAKLEPGRYDIVGDDVFALVQEYNTKPTTAGKWEAHKKYIDIQYIVSGKEKIGYSFFNKMIVTEEYKDIKDIMFLKGEGSFVIAESGYFALLFPTDIHMPGIAVEDNVKNEVIKVVVKVKVD